jgi:Zn-dependent protease
MFNRKFATVSGIDIYIKLSGFIILTLISSFAASYYKYLHPNISNYTDFLIFSSYLTCFFVSLMFHEFAHCLTARKFGIGTHRIEFGFFGAIAFFDKKSKSAKEEFLIAAAGPFVSFCLSAFFFFVLVLNNYITKNALFTEEFVKTLNPFSYIIYRLFILNGVFAVFNLIPIFPMDGGRILYSAVWKLSKNKLFAINFCSFIAYFIIAVLFSMLILSRAGVNVPIFGVNINNFMLGYYVGIFIFIFLFSYSQTKEYQNEKT